MKMQRLEFTQPQRKTPTFQMLSRVLPERGLVTSTMSSLPRRPLIFGGSQNKRKSETQFFVKLTEIYKSVLLNGVSTLVINRKPALVMYPRDPHKEGSLECSRNIGWMHKETQLPAQHGRL